MNTVLMNKEDIKNSFDQILSFKSEKDADAHNEYMIMFRFLSEVEEIMEERRMTKKKLASLIGTSASYVTQLFNGNKVINLDTLAKIERVLDIKFIIKAKKEYVKIESSDIDFITSFYESEEKKIKSQERVKIDWKVYVAPKGHSLATLVRTSDKILKTA